MLELKNCCLSNESLYALSKTLANMAQSLRHLNLRGNYFKNQSTLLQLAQNVKFLENLENLDLSENFLGNGVICVLSKSLKRTKKMTDLRLDYVEMEEVALSALICAIDEIPALRTLDIGRNLFGNNVLKFLSKLKGVFDS